MLATSLIYLAALGVRALALTSQDIRDDKYEYHQAESAALVDEWKDYYLMESNFAVFQKRGQSTEDWYGRRKSAEIFRIVQKCFIQHLSGNDFIVHHFSNEQESLIIDIHKSCGEGYSMDMGGDFAQFKSISLIKYMDLRCPTTGTICGQESMLLYAIRKYCEHSDHKSSIKPGSVLET